MALPPSMATRALISRSALASAARTAIAAGGTVADLRRDAQGHGLLRIARAVSRAGAECLLVDGESEVRMLRAEGITATAEATPDISTELLYGLPDDADPERRPVMRLTGRVMSVKPLRSGEAVSYGYTHRAREDTTVALVSGGYAQAIVRALGNTAHVQVGARLQPIVGRVAMDVCVVDLEATDPDAREGDEVTYFGGDGAARSELAAWAEATGLRAAELVCAVGLHASSREDED